MGEPLREWLILILCGVGTYALRASMIVVFARSQMPAVLSRAFQFVAPAVLAAIAVPSLAAPHGSVSLAESGPALVAAAAVVLLARRTTNASLPLVMGLAAWWAASALAVATL
jgi:branched-subunit amino acid transport protein